MKESKRKLKLQESIVLNDKKINEYNETEKECISHLKNIMSYNNEYSKSENLKKEHIDDWKEEINKLLEIKEELETLHIETEYLKREMNIYDHERMAIWCFYFIPWFPIIGWIAMLITEKIWNWNNINIVVIWIPLIIILYIILHITIKTYLDNKSYNDCINSKNEKEKKILWLYNKYLSLRATLRKSKNEDEVIELYNYLIWKESNHIDDFYDDVRRCWL